jgi:hypothetical protein
VDKESALERRTESTAQGIDAQTKEHAHNDSRSPIATSSLFSMTITFWGECPGEGLEFTIAFWSALMLSQMFTGNLFFTRRASIEVNLDSFPARVSSDFAIVQ